MPRFRPGLRHAETAGPLSLEQVRRLVADAIAPAHFFAGPATALAWEHADGEDVSWETFQGRLLDPSHTKQRRRFEAWNVFLVEGGSRSPEPLLSVKLDAAAGQLHVVRAIHCYAWEGYDAGDNVILSRETRKWVRELVGTVDLARFGSADDLRDEVICLLFHAVVGTSRLPLTSLEAPLPAYSLGELAYFYHPGRAAGPPRSHQDLLDGMLLAELSWLEKAKLLETLLHAAPPEGLAQAAARFVERWRSLGHDPGDIPRLFRTLFNEVSLSPWTDLVDKTLAFLRLLEEQGCLTPGDVIDLLGHLLRQEGRHLTAYDLVTFHHQGANYPDALLLDALLRAYLLSIERHSVLFLDAPGDDPPARKQQRLRRRALRQGWLARRRYEGHLVPATPTSQGENARVLPPSHPRVPDEEILYPHRRTRQLFAGDPLTDRLQAQGQAVLRQSIHDLHHPLELRELGMALFLDRPLGAAKGPVEPDRTLLLSYEAFSRLTAERRLKEMAQDPGLLEPAVYEELHRRLSDGLEVAGLPVECIAGVARPGTVSLADARRSADDYVLVRTTARATGDFLAHYELAPLAVRFPLDWLMGERPVLIVGEGMTVLTIHDDRLRPRLELTADPRAGYVCRAGIEYPAEGLRVRRVWVKDAASGVLQERDMEAEGIVIRPAI